ncbi:MAG: PD-(D/E)XK nuclease family protein [Chloroflexi bacterium]|nr:PD-(D/E)XK nuclease family protein [Chloroflexota bacterium]
MLDETTLQQLEAFDTDGLLKDLEKVLARFNLFDAIGATHKELWHSDFLAFLLDPAENHGLGDQFTRRFLTEAVPDLAGAESFENVRVQREHNFIDILIEDEATQTAVVVENKVWSPEGAGQLGVYWNATAAEHSGWTICGVYLTPSGQLPSDSRYRPISYRIVVRLLEGMLGEQGNSVQGDVTLVIQHYIDMLRRSIVGNADTKALARQLYFRHRSVLPLMNPNTWKKMIEAHLRGLVRKSELLASEGTSTDYVHFQVKEWDRAEGLRRGAVKDIGYQFLFFDWYNMDGSLTLYMWLSSLVPTQIHARIMERAKEVGAPFCTPTTNPQGWHYLYALPFLGKDHYTRCSDDELRAEIDAKWEHFVGQDLPAIMEAFRHQDWFWYAGDK